MQNGTNNGSPDEIVDLALKRGELDKLLLGYPEYCYIPRFSPCPENTEIITLIDALCRREDYEEYRQKLIETIFSIVDTYEGIYPVADCLFYETARLLDKRKTLGLPLEEITLSLRKTIKRFQDRLIADKTGGGMGHPNGRYGNLQGISSVVQNDGGMPFCQ